MDNILLLCVILEVLLLVLLKDLQSDPVVKDMVQFLYFIYPIALNQLGTGLVIEIVLQFTGDWDLGRIVSLALANDLVDVLEGSLPQLPVSMLGLLVFVQIV
jgi:hypothetical protein